MYVFFVLGTNNIICNLISYCTVAFLGKEYNRESVGVISGHVTFSGIHVGRLPTSVGFVISSWLACPVWEGVS